MSALSEAASEIESIQRWVRSNDTRDVTSKVRTISCAARKYDFVIARNCSGSAVSQT
jgi:hypothetical protein